MKTLLPAILLLAATTLPAASPIGGFLDMEPAGGFRVDDAVFRLTHFGVNWAITIQKPECVTPAEGYPVSTADSFELNGDYKVSNGVFKLGEAMVCTRKYQADFQLRLTSSAPVFTSDLALEVLLPAKNYLDRPIRANGKTVNFEKQFNENDDVKTMRLNQLVLPLDKGNLTLTGDFRVRFQDNRRYRLDQWSIRIQPDREASETREAALRLTLDYAPHLNLPLDLRSATGATFDLSAFPAGSAEYAGIGFDSRGDIIRLQGTSATVRLESPAAARCLYVLGALDRELESAVEIGTIVCEYDDDRYVAKGEQVFPVTGGIDVAGFRQPRELKNAAVGWQRNTPKSPAGLYVTRFRLSGKPVRKITFESNGAAGWLIAAVTLSDRRGAPLGESPVVMRPDHDWVELKNRKDVKPGGILDFSHLLDAPAGKHGFARNVNGRLEFEKRFGVPVRFYGANIAFDTHFMDRELTDKLAEHCARTGYNLIRMHHFDRELVERRGGRCTTLHPERLERMDYLLAALRKRGVYTTIDLFMMRETARGEFPENPDWTPTLEEYKALLFISDAAMRNYEEFAANLLNHVNPHTGLAWKEDPAIITMSMINEDTLFHLAFRTPPVARLYQAKFDAWLEERKISPNGRNLGGYRRQFLAEIYLRGFNRLEAFFRNLGVRPLLTDQNYISTLSTTLLRERYDFVDNHFYWSHPQFIGKNWTLPAIVANLSSIDRHAGGLREMFPTRIYGKPFSITEWDYLNPNSYAVEGAFLTGAYAALQDWSILCRFAYCNSPRQVAEDDSPARLFETINDPLRRLSEIAGVVAFLRGDVKSSKVNYPFLLSRKHLDNPENPDDYPALIQRLGLIGKTGTLLADSGMPLLLPPGTRALIGLGGEWSKTTFPVPYLVAAADSVPRQDLTALQKQGAVAREEYDPERDCYQSSTGELRLDRRNGTFQSITPRSESFVLKAGQELAGAFTAVSNRLAFGAFLIAARDERPLESSDRLLLLHLTGTRNTGQRFRNADGEVIEAWGRTPLLVRRGEAEITLNRDFSSHKLYAVDLDGSRAFEIPMTVQEGKTRFTLKNVTTKGVFVAYELTRDKR